MYAPQGEDEEEEGLVVVKKPRGRRCLRGSSSAVTLVMSI